MNAYIFKTCLVITSIISATAAFKQENCTNLNDPSLPLPTINIYKADLLTNKQIITNQTDLITFETSELKEIYFDLECKHNRPVNLIWDEHFINHEVKSLCDTRRNVQDFTDPSTYEYVILYTIRVNNPELHANEGRGEDHSLAFFCQSVDNPCSRSVAQAIFHPKNKTYSVGLLDNGHEDIEAVIDLETKLAQRLDGSLESCSEMNFTLFFGMKSANFFYDWKPATVKNNIYFIIEAQQFQNSFRFIPTLDDRCININYVEIIDEKTQSELCSSSSCKPLNVPLHRLRLPLFFGTVGNISRVIRGFYPVVGRKLTLTTRGKVDPQNLLQIKVTPKELYKGEQVVVGCQTSPYLFSYGVHIGWSLLGDSFPKEVVNASKEKEVYGAYKTTGQLLRPDKKFLDDNNVKFINVSCFGPVWNSTSWIAKSVTVPLKDSTLPTFTHFGANTVIKHEVKIGENLTLKLEAEGIPRPNITFTTTIQNLNFTETRMYGENSTTLLIYFPEIDPSYGGVYDFQAESVIGSTYATQEVVVVQGLSTFLIVISICAGVVLFVFILAVIFSVRKLKKEREEFIRDTDQIIKKFREGFKNEQGLGFDSKSEYTHYEIPITKWGTGGELLGSGAFGVVHKGFVQMGTNKQVVAVKTVNSPKAIEEFETSLKELTIMSYIGHHDNVVSLIAACTEKISKRSVLLGVEYCANGDLLSYLQKRKPLYQSFVRDGKISMDWMLNDDTNYTNISNASNFSTADLYRWAYQISNGMDYLETKRVLHADLAARNVLLTQDQIAKISDFGLSRQLTESSNYTKSTSCALPWRWMAIESLKFQQFSSKSDVWSYGVTLHEMFSLGEEPWPGLGWTLDFVQELEKGLRLAKPSNATDAMYNQIMLECWRNEPEERISFHAIKKFFDDAIAKLNSAEGKAEDYFAIC